MKMPGRKGETRGAAPSQTNNRSHPITFSSRSLTFGRFLINILGNWPFVNILIIKTGKLRKYREKGIINKVAKSGCNFGFPRRNCFMPVKVKLKIDHKNETISLPAIALRGLVVFPNHLL